MKMGKAKFSTIIVHISMLSKSRSRYLSYGGYPRKRSDAVQRAREGERNRPGITLLFSLLFSPLSLSLSYTQTHTCTLSPLSLISLSLCGLTVSLTLTLLTLSPAGAVSQTSSALLLRESAASSSSDAGKTGTASRAALRPAMSRSAGGSEDEGNDDDAVGVIAWSAEAASA
jgi:hypothetical protein